MGAGRVLLIAGVAACALSIRLEEGENFRTQPEDEWPQAPQEGQEVPTVDVEINELQGDWWLQEYVNSHDGKPIGPNQPYLCPESRMSITTNISAKSLNASQISYEWP